METQDSGEHRTSSSSSLSWPDAWTDGGGYGWTIALYAAGSAYATRRDAARWTANRPGWPRSIFATAPNDGAGDAATDGGHDYRGPNAARDDA